MLHEIYCYSHRYARSSFADSHYARFSLREILVAQSLNIAQSQVTRPSFHEIHHYSHRYARFNIADFCCVELIEVTSNQKTL
jgi:hypothetical protein